LNIQKLTAELMQKILVAEGELSISRTLGTFRLRFENDVPVQRSEDAVLEAETAAVREWAARYPELTVTYPQEKTGELTDLKDSSVRIEEYTVSAEIFVPEAFIKMHSGVGFRKILEEQYAQQTAALAEAVGKRLQKHEFRKMRLFGKSPYQRTFVMYVTGEAVRTETWMLPFSRFALDPLLWDSEICGMALLLCERLRGVFSEAFGDGVQLRIGRIEHEQCCTLIPNIMKEDAKCIE